MHTGVGKVLESYLDSRARIACPSELIPAPGQYLMAHEDASDSPLAVPVFFSESTPNGFRAALPNHAAWSPGARLYLRGPLGRGFHLPAAARRVALVAFDNSSARLRGLIPLASKQGSAITFVGNSIADDLAEEVEVQPLGALSEVAQWADFIAADVARENLSELLKMMGIGRQAAGQIETQILVRTSMPCGGLADCGVCAVDLKESWKMACKDGPVFEASEFA